MAENKFTRAEFLDCMTQDDMCYVFYTDKKHIMHFLSDNTDANLTDAECFTTNFNDALLVNIRNSEKFKFLCDFLFDNRVHHIVRMHTSVEWL